MLGKIKEAARSLRRRRALAALPFIGYSWSEAGIRFDLLTEGELERLNATLDWNALTVERPRVLWLANKGVMA